MKILQVVPSIGAESSGPSYSVPGLCRGLAANDVAMELHFLGNAIPLHLRNATYAVANYPQRDKFNLGWSPEMLKGLREACKTADIIHDNSLWMMPNVYPAWAVKGSKCKLVVAPRGTLAAWSLKKGWLKKKIFGLFLQNRVLRQADMFHATSEKEYEEIRALGYKQPVAIVPIGMDIPCGNEVKVRGEGEQRSDLHQVVFFGRLHKVKAVDRLVQAWELLTKEAQFHSTPTPSPYTSSSRWELVIAGPDNGIRGELEQYIATHQIPRVRFVGEINGQAKYDFLSAADLYVLPSFTENFGVTVAEALACGTPVIVSKGTPWGGVEKVDVGVEKRCRCRAEKKVDEWLCGVTRESFVSSLKKLVEEKTAAGEYRFRRSEERGLALKEAERFYDEFSRKIIPLSDGRCVYFTPDVRAKARNGNDLSRCWAEYAFHAVSSSGKMLKGLDYRERIYNSAKVADVALIGEIICAEHCMFRLIDEHPENDAVIFIGRDVRGGRVEVVTRLDENGNAHANLSEVTVIVQHARKKQTPPPKFRPLTEVVEAVAKHQAAGFSPSTTSSNIPNLPVAVNGAGEEGRGRDARSSVEAYGWSRCGWWVENDPETLAKTLREAMALSDEERRLMGENGRVWIRRDFSWEGIGAKMKAAYEWLLDPTHVEKPEFVMV